MFHTIARLRKIGEDMNRESNGRNGLEHVPACSTWPPTWLTEGVQPACKLPQPKLAELALDFSPWELAPDVYERWEERVCIMHFDSGLAWPEAEQLALGDVLCTAGQNAGRGDHNTANGKATTIQVSLFAADHGPYGMRRVE
jgi:hypothetical protein